MKIAAFDLGSTWAMACNKADPAVAFHQTDRGARGERLAAFAQGVMGGLLHGYDVVVYERPFARGQAATRALWGMAGVLEAAGFQSGCAVLDITPSEIKKWAAGIGAATKTSMLAAAHCLGYTGDNEHEADAFCLLKMAEATLTRG